MKGFKPTGFGPKSGFHFSPRMGFTGSTGSMTHVSPYVRKKAFATGGFVRQDTPRMTVADVGDPGSAMVRRARPFSEQEREAGGRSPLRPGFKDGGQWIKGAIKHPGALHKALGVPEGKKIPANKLAKAAHSSNPTMRRRAALAKTLGKMKKADGGSVPRRVKDYSIAESVAAIPKLIGAKVGMLKDAMSSGRKIAGESGRSIMEETQRAQTGKMASNYAKGGKMKRMAYADGGGVSRGEAKKIAERTVGEHVKYPAPKGHKGLGAMCK